MDDWKRAIVRIWLGQPNKGGVFQGTAFFINSHYLLTAKHVIENFDFNEIYLQSDTGAWIDGGLRKIQQPLVHPQLDVAVLPLAKPVENAFTIHFTDLEQSHLTQGQHVKLVGYSTAEEGLEIPTVEISAFYGGYNLEIAHTAIAKGMSGGAVLFDNKLVGITRAKDDAHTYIIPLRDFFDFAKPYKEANSYASLFQAVSTFELSELKFLLADVDVAVEQQTYAFFQAFFPESIRPISYGLIDCMEFLAQKTHSTAENAPLLALLEYCNSIIVGQLTAEKRVGLDLWKQNIAQKLTLNLKVIQNNVNASRIPQPASAVILLKIEPKNLISDELFILQVWLYLDNQYHPQDICEQDYTLQQLEIYLEDILRKTIRQLGPFANNIVIEIVLPITLFHWDINHLKIKTGPFKQALGKVHAINIRSWDRIYHSDYDSGRPKWGNKWQQLRCSQQTIQNQHIHYLDDENTCCEALYDELDRTALIFMPLCALPWQTERINEIFGTALAAGLPVVLWSPQATINEEIKQAIELLLCSHNSEQWIAKIQEQKNEQTFLNKLMILLDSPERLPPDTDYLLTMSD